jgi:hypothetical protein
MPRVTMIRFPGQPPDPEHVHVSSMFEGCERGTQFVKYTIGNRARRYSGDIGLPRLPLKGDARMPPPVSCFMPRPPSSLRAIAINSYFTDHAPARNQCSRGAAPEVPRAAPTQCPCAIRGMIATRKGGSLRLISAEFPLRGPTASSRPPQAPRRHMNRI